MHDLASEEKSLIEHIERYLGIIHRGWDKTPDGEKIDPQIVECSDGQTDQTRAFCTVGLSRHKLAPNARSGRPIQQELVILGPDDFDSSTIPALLMQLVSDVLKAHRAFLYGDVIERRNTMFNENRNPSFSRRS